MVRELTAKSRDHSTVEDWRDVKLTLSTAQPNLGDRALIPSALHIGAQSKPKLKVISQRTEDRRALQRGGGDSVDQTKERVSI